MSTYELFLADDHQLFLDGMITLIQEIPGFHVLGFSTNGSDALSKIALMNPDVAMLDIDMPSINGLLVLERLRKQGFNGKVIILSQFDEPSVIDKARKTGADGYLLKSSSKQVVIDAIQRVVRGESVFDLSPKESLRKPLTEQISSVLELTERELEIIHLIANGFSNREIGEKLFISHKTVDVHRTNLMKKLNVNNVASLVKLAYQQGLIDN